MGSRAPAHRARLGDAVGSVQVEPKGKLPFRGSPSCPTESPLQSRAARSSPGRIPTLGRGRGFLSYKIGCSDSIIVQRNSSPHESRQHSPGFRRPAIAKGLRAHPAERARGSTEGNTTHAMGRRPQRAPSRLMGCAGWPRPGLMPGDAHASCGACPLTGIAAETSRASLWTWWGKQVPMGSCRRPRSIQSERRRPVASAVQALAKHGRLRCAGIGNRPRAAA